MTKGKLCDMLINVAKDYRKENVLESLKRNKHMSDYKGEHIKDNVIDALLVDFINRVGMYQGLDLGLYTKHLNEDEKISEYYYKNSITTMLSHKGTELLRDELELHKYKCKICGSILILITMAEGSFVVCSNKIFNHNCGYHINIDLEKAPMIKEDYK